MPRTARSCRQRSAFPKLTPSPRRITRDVLDLRRAPLRQPPWRSRRLPLGVTRKAARTALTRSSTTARELRRLPGRDEARRALPLPTVIALNPCRPAHRAGGLCRRRGGLSHGPGNAETRWKGSPAGDRWREYVRGHATWAERCPIMPETKRLIDKRKPGPDSY